MLVEILYINHFFGCMFYAAGVYMYTNHPSSKTWVNDPTMNFGVVITRKATSKYVYLILLDIYFLLIGLLMQSLELDMETFYH